MIDANCAVVILHQKKAELRHCILKGVKERWLVYFGGGVDNTENYTPFDLKIN